MAIVKVQAKGQMTVPLALRQALDIKTGTDLVCIQTGPGTFTCHVLPGPERLRAFIDAHTIDCPDLTQDGIDAAIEDGMRAEAEARYRDVLTAAHRATSRSAQRGA